MSPGSLWPITECWYSHQPVAGHQLQLQSITAHDCFPSPVTDHNFPQQPLSPTANHWSSVLNKDRSLIAIVSNSQSLISIAPSDQLLTAFSSDDQSLIAIVPGNRSLIAGVAERPNTDQRFLIPIVPQWPITVHHRVHRPITVRTTVRLCRSDRGFLHSIRHSFPLCPVWWFDE